MDRPLAVKSVFTPYVSDNGYKFTGVNTIFVLSNDDGTLVTYDESSTTPFGTISLVTPVEQELTLAYNQAMARKIQRTQIQDIPVSSYAKKWAVQQVARVFIPAHDAYSLGKVKAARPAANVVTVVAAEVKPDGTENLSFKFETALNKIKTNGGAAGDVVAWSSYTFTSVLSAQITFTGSDAGYNEAKNTSYLGRYKGVTMVEVPDAYLGAGTHVLMADKRSIIAVTPKMSPEDMDIIEKVPGFSGIEIQLRDRGDTFVLNRQVGLIASVEDGI